MRRGFSLIELVVSIVVVGITLVSIPTLFLQTSLNNSSAIVQETVMDAKTRMALILKSPWGCPKQDENRTYTNTPIFNAPATVNNFYSKNNISPDNRREYTNEDEDTSCSGWGQSISSFNGDIVSTTTSAGYNRDSIVAVELRTATYTKDMSNNQDKNIKKIEITATTKDIKAKNQEGYEIILRSYSTNIGDGPKIATGTW